MQETLDRWINNHHWCYDLVARLCRRMHGLELSKEKYIEIQSAVSPAKNTN